MVSHAERRRNAGSHRFLISGSDLRIDASFSRFKPSCVHRFLISGPNLGIDAKKPSRTAQRLHRFLISGPDLGIDAASSLLQLRTARLQHHRSCAEERPSCRMTVADAGGDRMPRRRHKPKLKAAGVVPVPVTPRNQPGNGLSLPQRPSASDSILRFGKGE